MNKKERFSMPAIGGSSLLVIFAVLCLTMFALLSLNTVLASERLSTEAVEAIAEYYDADYRAEEIFALLRQGEMPEGVTEENGIYSYSCSISDTQTLFVEIQYDGEDWNVLRWQSVSSIK